MGIVTIDFEASCLPQRGLSYPIEVGIASVDGSSAWLIRPDDSWLGWQWSGEAERLHGLTRGQIQEEGRPVEFVAFALLEALSGHRVIADSDFDSYWLETLLNAAGVSATVQIEHVRVIFDELETTTDEIEKAQAAIVPQTDHRHRARYDALWLHALIERLTDACVMRRVHPVPHAA